MVALLNWEPIMNLENAKEIERHNKSNETFILLSGQAALYVTRSNNLQVLEMQPGLVYNVTAGTWHNILATHDVKLAIVENRNTHLDDSETRSLNTQELLSLKSNLPKWINESIKRTN